MEKMQHFSIRKLSIGAASVLIGISFLGVKASTVKADSLQNTSATELTKSKTANEAIKQDADSDIKQELASDIKQEPVSKTDAKQINNDQPNADQTPAQPVTSKPNSNQQNAADLEAKPQTPDKVKLQTNSVIIPDKAGQSKVKTTNLMAIAGKKLNAQMLSESKVASPTKDTNDAYALDSKNGLHEHANVNDNGGYDKDYWGAIDLNNWNYTQDEAGDITLSGYKGSDNTKIIIPNIADFAHGNVTQTITLQVDPNVDTNKVYISSDVMHDLAKNATRIGLSKTANKKVIAKDAIWSNAFGGMTNEPGTDSNANGGIKYSSPNLTQMDLHNLDTESITDMSALFNGGNNLITVGDLSDWNTRNVTNMHAMFQAASSLINIGNLDNWDTSNVTNMAYMFTYAINLTNIGNLSKWNTSKVTDMHNMFANATSLTNIGNLDNWDTNKVTNMALMFASATNLTNIGDLSKWQTGNVTDMNNMFANATNLTNIGNLDNWDTSKVTDMYYMFGTDPGKQSHLTNIGDLSKWQTGNVTDMNNMFANATGLTNIGNLDNWNTSNVTDMSWMFSTDSDKQSHLTNIGNLDNWDTSKVTNMAGMFNNATNLTNIGNLDNWDTSKVTDMHWMFGTNDDDKQSHLTNIGDLSKWQTGNVTNMAYMFTNSINLTNIGNLSKWNTSKVTNMLGMFGNTNALRHLNISNWNLTKLANKDSMQYMFTEDPNLTVIANDLKLPTWYENEINNADYFWNNHIAVITNVPELIKSTSAIDNLKIDEQDASRSIFYDSKDSSDAIKVLTDANNQYIADYHKSNPTKFLKLAETVNKNDPISLANASFVTVPAVFNITVHFEDVDPNADKDNDTVKQELAKTVELSGHSGDAADLSQVQLPTNFELSGDLPSAIFGDTDSVTIKLKHKLSDDIHQGANGMASARTDVIAPDGTVLIHGEVGIASFIDQRQDLVTGQMVNGNTNWTFLGSSQTNASSDILDKYIEQYDPVIINTYLGHSTEGWQYALGGLEQPLQIKLKAGYTIDANPELWHDWNNNGTYTWDGLRSAPNDGTYTGSGLQGASDSWNAMQQLNRFSTDAVHIVPLNQSVHYQFMDNGAQVGSDVILTGKTDETVPTNLSIPENYELADGTTLPTNYTFAATNPTIQINLKHKTETSVESLPATRTINVHLPNGTTKVYQQIIGYQRDVITDLVTKTVTHGTWVVNDVTSSFTIDGVKQLEQSYVLRNGNYKFAGIKLPKVPGYKAVIKTVPNQVNPASSLFTVSFMALPKPVKLTPNDVEPAKTVASATTETADLIKTEPKVTISATPKTIDLSEDAVATTSKEATWHVANEPEQNIYRVSNGKYTVELPHISNAQLHVLANDSAKDSILFTYKGQNTKYVFNIKFANGHYLLTTYKIKSGKLIKLIDYNFIKSSKMIDAILGWLKLQ